jgi:hypothetical protein
MWRDRKASYSRPRRAGDAPKEQVANSVSAPGYSEQLDHND